jgi:beta-lactamase class A
MSWRTLHGSGPQRFVAPYPASLLKLMVAVGVGMAVDTGRATWAEVLPALGPMITVSDNDATTACVALLHRHGLVALLNDSFAERGLATLQLNDTQPDGGWRNADGSGVGHIHMTAWDTVRLLWLLDADAPPAPWAAATAPLLQPATRDALRAVLARQQLDQVLSSGSLRAVPGWVPGLPDAPAFAHKTGTTDNYASDAGIVRLGRTHYIVALLSSLGSRYAPDERCASTWRLPALGARIHALMESLP